MVLHSLQQRLDQLLQPHRARQLAKEHGWFLREGKISPFEFLFSPLGQASALKLTLSAQASSLSQPVTRQAVDQRYNPAAVKFFEAAFQECLATTLAWNIRSTMTQLIGQHFPAIRLFDSTHCPCSDALAQIFPGCGGSGGTAGLKVLLSYEYGSGQLHPLAVLPANRSDQSLAIPACAQVASKELGIFDKGFYKAPVLRSVHERGGFFLIPWHHGVSVSELDAQGQPKALDVAAHLNASTEIRVEWSAVELGQTEETRLGPVRLVAFRLPEEAANRRRAALREKCRTRGRQPTAQALELAGWLILLTNASAELLPSTVLSYLYRVRWQVELVFKQWKSVLRLDVLTGKNPYRVQCEVWGRLLVALLSFVWYQHTNAACLRLHEREISFFKLAQQLQQHGQELVQVLFTDRGEIDSKVRTLWTKILKLARKERQPSRPTTWENLCEHWLETQAA
jgi:hypothetical protein